MHKLHWGYSYRFFSQRALLEPSAAIAQVQELLLLLLLEELSLDEEDELVDDDEEPSRGAAFAAAPGFALPLVCAFALATATTGCDDEEEACMPSTGRTTDFALALGLGAAAAAFATAALAASSWTVSGIMLANSGTTGTSSNLCSRMSSVSLTSGRCLCSSPRVKL